MRIEQFFKGYDTIRSMFMGMGLSWQRTDALMLLLKMTIYYQKPIYPSAPWVAEQVGISEKTVDRLISWLKEEGLISVKRTRREDGYWSVNRMNLGALIYKLRKLLGPLLNRYPKGVRLYRSGNSVTLKVWFVNLSGESAGPSWWESHWSFGRLPTGKTSTLWRNPLLAI